jgi:hypothetical protein
MIFNIKSIKDKLTEQIYKKSMQELDDFYKRNWTQNCPRIFIMNDRKTIDLLKKRKTEPYVVAFAYKRDIYLLNPKKYKTESNHKYNKEDYAYLIKHELSHVFIRAFIKNYCPLWFNEGLAVCLSGQLKFKTTPKKFMNFLSFYDKGGKNIYSESGFVISLLIKKFGQRKILKLIKSLKTINNQKDFENKFFEIYNFKLNYKNINSLF